jgi:hypothetical protein
MDNELYSLSDVLAIANIHPFYVPSIEYPPDANTIHATRERAAEKPTKASDLTLKPLLRKKDL